MIQGALYRSMIGVVEGGLDELAISAYQKAQEISPNNPNITFEIGLTYLAKYDLMSKQNLPESKQYLEFARQSFEKSIELKPDYDAANFQIAMVYVRESKIDDAIQKLESLKASLPLDPGLAFQLGVLYFNKNELEKARLEFERAVLVDPNYSNARYFLGLVLDLQGKKDEAISQFEIVESLNPDNQEVKDILKNLREGKSVNDLIKPPTQELPITNKNEGLKNNR
jgi:tetratricopeptide (TPR) repeat protein